GLAWPCRYRVIIAVARGSAGGPIGDSAVPPSPGEVSWLASRHRATVRSAVESLSCAGPRVSITQDIAADFCADTRLVSKSFSTAQMAAGANHHIGAQYASLLRCELATEPRFGGALFVCEIAPEEKRRK